MEWNYKIHDKEMLAIIRVLEEWRHFLEGAQHPVEIWMDHKNLKYFMMAKKLNHRQACWSLYLAHFNFKLIYCPGCSMGKPDALSRRLDHGNGASDNKDMVHLQLELFAIQALKGVQLEGPECDILREIHQENQKDDQKEPVAKAVRELWQAAGKTVHSVEWLEDRGLLRGMVGRQRTTPVQRQDLCSPEHGLTKTSSLPVS